MRILPAFQLEVTARRLTPEFREKMLFTHRGLSGPAILQISTYWQAGHASASTSHHYATPAPPSVPPKPEMPLLFAGLFRSSCLSASLLAGWNSAFPSPSPIPLSTPSRAKFIPGASFQRAPRVSIRRKSPRVASTRVNFPGKPWKPAGFRACISSAKLWMSPVNSAVLISSGPGPPRRPLADPFEPPSVSKESSPFCFTLFHFVREWTHQAPGLGTCCTISVPSPATDAFANRCLA